MKRIIMCLALLLCALCLCGGNRRQKLYVYNWTYYMPPDVLDDFRKKFNVDLVYDVYPSNEDMFAKLKSGATGYDIVVPSGDFVSIMIHEGMLAPIDKTRLPNFENIDTAVLHRVTFDQGNQFSVPYMMGASGIAVNKKQVVRYDRSWSIFDRVDLRDRMTMLDDMREVIGAALKRLGYSVNTTDTSELSKAKAVVLGWKKNIVKFDAESFAKGFATGEFQAVHGYAENIFREYDSTRRDEVDFFIPREGGPMYMDNLVILKNAPDKDAAYTFINYIHSPEIFARIVDYLGYPCINAAARPLLKRKPNYELSDLRNCEFKEDLGANIELYNKLWEQIRMGD
ncbi:MAG: extracellular solute-binding protein [Chitinispirillaceae bacterium]|jgi:spermidine/putrescine transport system substrate-binding protein